MLCSYEQVRERLANDGMADDCTKCRKSQQRLVHSGIGDAILMHACNGNSCEAYTEYGKPPELALENTSIWHLLPNARWTVPGFDRG